MIQFAAAVAAAWLLAALIEYLIALAAASRAVPVRVHATHALKRLPRLPTRYVRPGH